MGLATEGNNIGIYKAYIKDADSLKYLTLPPLFSKSNKLNPGPVSGFLPILTVVDVTAVLPYTGTRLVPENFYFIPEQIVFKEEQIVYRFYRLNSGTIASF